MGFKLQVENIVVDDGDKNKSQYSFINNSYSILIITIYFINQKNFLIVEIIFH